MTISIQALQGTHNDSRIAHLPNLYSCGSYISHEIPSTYTYIYAILHNAGHSPCTPEQIFIKNAQGTEVHFLDLPLPELRNSVIHPDGHLVLGFSQHLFTRCLQWGGLFGEQSIRFCCVYRDEYAESAPLTLNMDTCPSSPLEDMELLPYAPFFLERSALYAQEMARIRAEYVSLERYADIHTYWGIHLKEDENGVKTWHILEYMPHAEKVWLTTDKLKFQRWAHHMFQPCHEKGLGWWELRLPFAALEHGTYVQLCVQLPDSPHVVRRVPAMARWVEQDELKPNQWCARVWHPEQAYSWKHDMPAPVAFPRIYEAHIGMAQSPPQGTVKGKAPVGTFADFARNILPRIKESGYTHVQLMGVLEHPLYKSFGYQVSSYFATSSRFGTVRDFQELVDTAHGLDIRVIVDIPHSHACPNTEEGIARYDGSPFFFSAKENQWGTLSFDYSQDMTRRFLLSNCRYWLEEFRIDGFRFDAVGNILYKDHGHDDDFSHVGRCFYGKDGKARADTFGQLYLALVNTLIHSIAPQAISIAEEFSGMPGLTCAPEHGGFGFDYRFAMGIPDYWENYINDEDKRHMGPLWHEMTNHRPYDNTISYVECHDQCINGHDAMIWRIIGNNMYTGMTVFHETWNVSRGIALYKLMRCITLCTAHYGYLNFMGAEFGHPEWLDELTNGHRQWHLADDTTLRYSRLAAFDKACMFDLVEKHLDDFRSQPLFRHIHEENRTLAFERGRLLFVYNFHEVESQDHLELLVSPGKYVEILSTDEKDFGGHGNVIPGTEHFSRADSGIASQSITVYIPPMTALVLVRM